MDVITLSYLIERISVHLDADRCIPHCRLVRWGTVNPQNTCNREHQVQTCGSANLLSIMPVTPHVPGQDGPPQLNLNCLIEGEYKVFKVTVEHDWEVNDLKEGIRSKATRVLKDVDAYTLELWKVSAIDDLRCEVTSFLSAKGLYACGSRRNSGCTYWVPGTWSFGICGQIRVYAKSHRKIFNAAS